jgi:hypothetical protein
MFVDGVVAGETLAEHPLSLAFSTGLSLIPTQSQTVGSFYCYRHRKI